jgi:hypothetical protein
MPTWDSGPRTALLLDNNGHSTLPERGTLVYDVVTRIG